MNIDLTAGTAIVTGSTEGIGFAIAKGLAEAGATVVLNGRTPVKVKAAVNRLGVAARGVAADASRLSDGGRKMVSLMSVIRRGVLTSASGAEP